MNDDIGAPPFTGIGTVCGLLCRTRFRCSVTNPLCTFDKVHFSLAVQCLHNTATDLVVHCSLEIAASI